MFRAPKLQAERFLRPKRIIKEVEKYLNDCKQTLEKHDDQDDLQISLTNRDHRFRRFEAISMSHLLNL